MESDRPSSAATFLGVHCWETSRRISCDCMASSFEKAPAFARKDERPLRAPRSKVAFDRQQVVTREDLFCFAQHFDGQMTSAKQARRRCFGRLGSVGEEMVKRLVGVDEGVALGQAPNQSGHLANGRGKALRELASRVHSPAGNVANELAVFTRETVCRAEQETVIRPAGGLEPAGIIALPAAHRKDTAYTFPRHHYAVGPATVLEENKIGKSPRQLGRDFGAEFV